MVMMGNGDGSLKEDPRIVSAAAALDRGHQAQVAFRLLEEYLLQRQQQLDREMFAVIEKGKGDPSWIGVLENFCIQKYETHRFLRLLMQRLNAGESARQTLADLGPHMELKNE